jgi:PAS domain S-box-containing protein
MDRNNSSLIRKMIDITGNACGLFDQSGMLIYGNEILHSLNAGPIADSEEIHADSFDLYSSNYNKLILWSEIVEWVQDKPFQLAVRAGRSSSRVFRCRVGKVDDAGESYYLMVLNDITPQAELEARMAERDSILERVINEFPLMICAMDNEGVIRIWNRTSEAVTGFKPEEMIGNPGALAMLFPATRDLAEALTKWNQRSDNVIRSWEMVMTTKSGDRKPISWTVRYRENPIVEGLYHWGIGMDMTEYKSTVDELKRNEDRLAFFLRATHDAIYDWDIPADDLWWSDGVTQLFGHNKEEIGSTLNWWESNLHPSYAHETIDSLNRAIAGTDSFWTFEYLFRKKDGTYAYVNDKGFFIRDEQGKALRMIGGMIDLTRITEAEKKLSERDEELRKLLHFNSSRLRGPLARIIQLTKLLAAMPHESGQVRDMIEQLLLSARELDLSYKRMSDVADEEDEDEE